MKDKILQAKYGTPDKPLKIGEFEIQCYVLDNDQRVLVQSGLLKALGMSTGGSQKIGTRKIDEFIQSSTIKPFISNELSGRVSNAIEFKAPNGKSAFAYEATILVDICDAILEANKRGKLHPRQFHIADRAESLIRAFAKVGIIALVDEATGYQEIRGKSELQTILKAYISEELLPWTKRFPDEFYKEMFRLNGWTFNPASVKRPSVIGHWTNSLVYDQLPKGVKEELQANTPKDDKGRRKHKFHQLLTHDIGNPHLEKQLVSVITLMNVSANWRAFKSLFARKFGQQEIDFHDE